MLRSSLADFCESEKIPAEYLSLLGAFSGPEGETDACRVAGELNGMFPEVVFRYDTRNYNPIFPILATHPSSSGRGLLIGNRDIGGVSDPSYLSPPIAVGRHVVLLTHVDGTPTGSLYDHGWRFATPGKSTGEFCGKGWKQAMVCHTRDRIRSYLLNQTT